ncbi:MAG TPA: trypsin-like serine protease [Elusimicrobiota bacterium]|nr:trypsin-like serine protease [Elusimicrobiota bacterium]
MKKAAALVFALALARPAGAFIINGLAAQPGQLPQVVRVDLPGRGLCSGTLVGPDTVLTAAHCLAALGVDPDKPGAFVEFSGQAGKVAVIQALMPAFSWSRVHSFIQELDGLYKKINAGQDLSQEDQARAVQIFAGLMGQERHDIALLKLAPGAAAGVAPMPVLLHAKSADAVGANVTIAGYGCANLMLGGWGIKRTGSNRVLAFGKGLFFLAGARQAPIHFFFHASLDNPIEIKRVPDGNRASAAEGDSGGPLIEKSYVIGVGDDTSSYDDGLLRAFNAALGKNSGADTSDQLSWYASLSDPDNARFLKDAARAGYRIDWADIPASARASRVNVSAARFSSILGQISAFNP